MSNRTEDISREKKKIINMCGCWTNDFFYMVYLLNYAFGKVICPDNKVIRRASQLYYTVKLTECHEKRTSFF